MVGSPREGRDDRTGLGQSSEESSASFSASSSRVLFHYLFYSSSRHFINI